MAATNYDDVLNQLRAAGFVGRGVDDGLRIGTPKPVRCHIEGDREKRGWYLLTEWRGSRDDLLIVGSFGIWHGNDNGARKIELRRTEFSREERDALRKRLAEQKRKAAAELAADQARAARHAAVMWSKCAAAGEAEYLVRKGVRALGIRFSPQGAAVVPVMDTAGVVHGLQVIRTAAQAKTKHRPEKEFWPVGLAKKGHFHLIGMPTWIVLIAEGYATAASLHDATGLPVAVAFDANNLAPVAAALAKRYRGAKILLCADDDILAKCHARIDDGHGAQRTCNARLILPDHPETCPTCGQPHRAANTGVDAAAAAALEVDGAWIRPLFADEAARRALFLDRGIKHTDFNDLARTETTNAVRMQVETRLTELKWGPQAIAAPISQTGGAGRAALKPIASSFELLQRYALVYGKNKTVFDRQEHCLLPLGDMRDACISKGIYNAWYEHPERAIVRPNEVGFDPGGEDLEVTCNLWGGWPTTPRKGDCEIMLELLRYLCSKEEKSHALFEWVLRWLAFPIQHPGAKMKTALVFHGPSGAGKNRFFEAYMSIFGPYGRVIDQNAVDDKFTDWAEKKLFLLADEIVARQELYHVKNKLKALITGDWIRINPKTIAAHDERNHINIVFLSNEAQPVVLEEDDRRYTVIWTPAKYQALPSGGRADDGFYRKLRDAARDPAVIAALHDHLLRVDMGDFDEGTLPPHTDAKFELVSLSLDSPSRFYYALIQEDVHVPFCPALSADVYECYRIWCQRSGETRYLRSQAQFINTLVRKHKVVNQRKRYLGEDPLMPSEDKLFGPHGVLMLGSEEMPPAANEHEWLGGQIGRFRAALKDLRGGLFA